MLTSYFYFPLYIFNQEIKSKNLVNAVSPNF